MPLPYTANEEARQHCLGRLRLIKDCLNRGNPTTLDDVDRALREALRHLSVLMSRVDLDDISEVIDDIREWGEQ